MKQLTPTNQHYLQRSTPVFPWFTTAIPNTRNPMTDVYLNPRNTSIAPEDLSVQADPENLVVADPAHFQVHYVINPWMSDHVGRVNSQKALCEWRSMVAKLWALQVPRVTVIPAMEGLFDQIFATDSGLAFLNADNEACFLTANFAWHYRQNEAEHAAHIYHTLNHHIISIPQQLTWEKGDVFKIPERRGYIIGYGKRTKLESLPALAKVLNGPVLGIQLLDDRFYHLDCCFWPLYSDVALVYRPAIHPDSLALIDRFFPNQIHLSEREASRFATNGRKIGRQLIINQNALSRRTKLALRALVWKTHREWLQFSEIDVEEIAKAGGSIHCMTNESY